MQYWSSVNQLCTMGQVLPGFWVLLEGAASQLIPKGTHPQVGGWRQNRKGDIRGRSGVVGKRESVQEQAEDKNVRVYIRVIKCSWKTIWAWPPWEHMNLHP